MRLIMFVSTIALTLAGCTPGTTLYSMPAQNNPISTQKASRNTPNVFTYEISTHHGPKKRQKSEPVKKHTPKKKNGPAGNKSLLNDAMGVSVKFFKDGIRYIKPKLAKLSN